MEEVIDSETFDLQPYQYSGLAGGNIRLIALDPQGTNSILRCRMITIPFYEVDRSRRLGNRDLRDSFRVQVYAALSYAWGQTYPDGSHLSRNLICNGKSIPITATLEQALRRLTSVDLPEIWERLRFRRNIYSDDYQVVFDRHRDDWSGVHLLWVDATCINQADPEERNEQVMFMNEIFSHALYLIVWLGEFSPGDHGIAEREVLRYYSRFYKLRRTDPCGNQSMVQAVTSLAQRPWHTRRWVVQEFLAGKRTQRYILCGDTLIGWQDFYTMLDSRNLTRHTPVLRSFQSCLMGSKSIRPEQAYDAVPMLHLLHLHGAAQCSDPRDRLYALRGLAPEGEEISVDYRLSTPVIYLDLAKALLGARGDHTRALLACATARQGKTHSEGLPSWVPDWTVDKPQYQSPEHRKCVYFATHRNYVSYSNVRHSAVVRNDRYLVLEGYIVPLCFPPAHAEMETECRSCLLFYTSWYEAVPSNIWSQELKKVLESAATKKEVVLVTRPAFPAFVLTPSGLSPEQNTTYRAQHCFDLFRKTSCTFFPFGAAETIWLE